MMRISILIVLSLIILTNVFGQLPSNKLNIVNVTGDFYVYTTWRDVGGKPFPSNSMYVVTSAGVVLFDTPWDSTQFQPLLDSITARHNKNVILCIATHYHEDRTAGLDFLKQKGIKTYSSKQTYDLCRLHHEKQAAFYFEKDTTFAIGTYLFETYYPGEGHTKDNIVVWCDKEKILYGGCLIKSTENDGLGNTADANVVAWEYSIRNVMKRFPNPQYVIPGHFGWISNKGLQHTLQLLEQNKKK